MSVLLTKKLFEAVPSVRTWLEEAQPDTTMYLQDAALTKVKDPPAPPDGSATCLGASASRTTFPGRSAWLQERLRCSPRTDEGLRRIPLRTNQNATNPAIAVAATGYPIRMTSHVASLFRLVLSPRILCTSAPRIP
ncbi:hypothetical protein BN77_2495 [Rhizobium mesoamericanum STM3625]|uniref:Uncharacterized protein n=1 Tax=Rhizobium mesoamericanum STM3625 TaxID=1211777 RepID=K0PV58_9HYPH|nr:hypothetical protein BN77_2495 [Rhizobium mesoamericanum STM3625]